MDLFLDKIFGRYLIWVDVLYKSLQNIELFVNESIYLCLDVSYFIIDLSLLEVIFGRFVELSQFVGSFETKCSFLLVLLNVANDRLNESPLSVFDMIFDSLCSEYLIGQISYHFENYLNYNQKWSNRSIRCSVKKRVTF